MPETRRPTCLEQIPDAVTTAAALLQTRRLWRAAPDGLLAAVLLSFLATAGFFYVNIMPAIVSGLIDGLHFSARDAGHVGSANVYGAALGALSAVWLSARLPWRTLAVAALCGLVALDLLSLTVAAPLPLIGVRFAHGLVGGCLVGTAFSVIARTRVPERTFGMLLIVQYGLGGLCVMVLPRLVTVLGSRVLFLVLGAFSLVTLAMLPFLADYPRPAARDGSAATAPSGRGRAAAVPVRALLVLSLLAVFFFQFGNMAVFAYVIELGRSFGLATNDISTTIGIAGWVGAAGAVMVIVLGVKWGRVRPVLLAVVVCAAGMLLFHLSASGTYFAAANVITSVAWGFGIPYLLGMCAAFDRSGRAATVASVFSKVGLASGPLAASVLADGSSWPLLINIATAAVAASCVCALAPAARLDRAP